MQSSSGAGKFPLIFEVRLRSWSRVQGSPLRVESCLGHSSTWWRLVFRCPHQSPELPCSTALREFSGVLGPRLLSHKRLQVYIRWLIPAGLLLGSQWQLAFLPSLSCYSFLLFLFLCVPPLLFHVSSTCSRTQTLPPECLDSCCYFDPVNTPHMVSPNSTFLVCKLGIWMIPILNGSWLRQTPRVDAKQETKRIFPSLSLILSVYYDTEPLIWI